MKKGLFLLPLALTITLITTAQSNADYIARAAEWRKEIWETKDADFEDNTVPEKYKNESAVILAKKYHISASSKGKIKMGILLSMTASNELVYTSTLREKVLIQDKAALEDFATIGYKKLSNNSVGNIITARFRDNIQKYIGAKIIKKNGAVNETFMDEAVTTQDEKNQKEEKLAIPDLEVGDMLDFFIVSEEKRELTSIPPMQIILSGEYPIVHFALQGNISKKLALEYKCINGAPPLNLDREKDGDILLEAREDNLDKFNFANWSSPFREGKIIRLNIAPGYSGLELSAMSRYGIAFEKGSINNGLTEEQIYDNEVSGLSLLAGQYNARLLSKEQKTYINNCINNLKKRLGTNPDPDSLVFTIYNALRYTYYFSAEANGRIYPGQSRNYSYLKSQYFSSVLSFLLNDNGIRNDLIFYSTRYMPRLQDLMTIDQPKYIVHVPGTKEKFLTDDGIFTEYGAIPSTAEGEKGVTLEYGSTKDLSKNKRKKMDQGNIVLPVSAAADNQAAETVELDFDISNTPTILIQRAVACTGHMKEDDQQNLLLFEDYYKDARLEQGEPYTFTEELAENKKTQSLAEEWQTVFAKARETYKESFEKDIKEKYGIEAKELLQYNIVQSGITATQPTLKYVTKFAVQDWLKKAGNNYLMEIGKLTGQQTAVKEEDRKRTIDIYPPFARTVSYQLTVNIPTGYSAEGIENLQTNIVNECGKFVTTAMNKENKLIIHVSKEYSHNFEPAANWPQLLAILDAAYNFSNAKFLLKKL